MVARQQALPLKGRACLPGWVRNRSRALLLPPLGALLVAALVLASSPHGAMHEQHHGPDTWLAASSGMPGSSPSAEQGRPDILLVLLDQWRADHDGFGSPAVSMPHYRALAARGVRFSQVFVASPVCAPSRAALAAGLSYARLRRRTGERLLGDHFNSPSSMKKARRGARGTTTPALYSTLQAAGYWTMTVGKDDLTKETGVGLDGGLAAAARLGFNASVRTLGKVKGRAPGTCHLESV